jgi:tetratricopeptide (TPR) repeat protein
MIADLPKFPPAAADFAEMERLIAAGQSQLARGVARLADHYVPADEAEWRRYHRILEALELRAQDEIMTDKFVTRYPESSSARLVLGGYLVSWRRRAAAQVQADLAFARPEPSPAFWNQLGRLVWQLGNWRQMIAVAAAGLAIDPANFRMHFNQAAAQWFLGRAAAAGAGFEAALRYANGRLTPYLDVVEFADRWGPAPVAEAAWDSLLQRAAGWRETADWLEVMAFLREHRNQTRIDAFCAVAAGVAVTDPGLLTALFDYANVETDPATAAAIGRRLLSVRPDSPDAARKLVRLETRLNGGTESSEDWWQDLKAAAPRPKTV